MWKSAILISLFMPITGWAKATLTDFGPCSCVWDNALKEYPADSKSEGLFRTTVRYQCGYICKNAQGKVEHIRGNHSVSFFGNEKGDEVICDGLVYEAHSSPFGNQWISYFWDGVLRSFDARTSTSPSLRAWAESASCAQAPALRRSSGAVGNLTVDEHRVELGLPAVTPEPLRRSSATPLDSQIAALCRLTPEQKDFQTGLVSSGHENLCHSEASATLKQKFEALRNDAYHVKSSKIALQKMAEVEEILLCPYFLERPAASNLKIMTEQWLKGSTDNEIPVGRLRSLACSYGLRGVRFNQLPRALQNALSQ